MAQPAPNAKSGNLFIVAAPSGAGKSSLVHALLEAEPGIKLSIAHTTRAPRPGEVNGREYHFTTVEDFEAGVQRGDFLESALVHGNYYGTSRVWIEEQLTEGSDVLLEIDWQGAQQVRGLIPGTIGIFILPPSAQELSNRLHKRGTDSEEVIARRLAGAAAEMAHAPEFEYVIINEDFDTALGELVSVVRAARLAYGKQAVRHRQVLADLGVPVP